MVNVYVCIETYDTKPYYDIQNNWCVSEGGLYNNICYENCNGL